MASSEDNSSSDHSESEAGRTDRVSSDLKDKNSSHLNPGMAGISNTEHGPMYAEASSSSPSSSEVCRRTSDTPSSLKDVKQSSVCRSLPENSNANDSLFASNCLRKKTDVYPSLPRLSRSGEEDMNVDDDSANSRVLWLGTKQSQLMKLDSFSPDIFFNMAICKNSHTDLAEEAKNTRFCTRSSDQYHVFLPFYPKKGSDDRWKTIRKSLYNLKEGRVANGDELKELILNYNGSYRNKWDFDGLLFFWNDMADNPLHRTSEAIDILTILPKMAELALDLESIVPTQIPFLRRGKDRSIALSKKQIACLLAHAFFCTYPMRNVDPVRDKYSWSLTSPSLPLPSINFSSLFKFGNISTSKSKLLCIFNYFRRIINGKYMSDEKVIFKRQSTTSESTKWRKSKKFFTRLHVAERGHIERQIGFLQVDFANKYVGGGVLGRGCVQEEIWFLASPELIVSRLFTEVLEPDEVLIITGSEIYNDYRGYASTFEWIGNFYDRTHSMKGVKVCQMVAMDATKYHRDEDQFSMTEIDRELNKAYCGFLCKSEGGVHSQLPAVATGNWGCGAFSGDKHLKSLIQMMAAAEAGRDVCFFTHHDKELLEKMHECHEFITKHNLTIGVVYEMITNYVAQVKSNRSFRSSTKLYDYILSRFSNVTFSKETSV